jgi:amino acid transporter
VQQTKLESENLELEKGNLSLWETLAQGLGANSTAVTTALLFVGLAAIVGDSLPLVVLLAFSIYLGMTLITYEWSKEVSSAYSWAAFHRRAFKRFGKFLSFCGGTTFYYYSLLGYVGFSMFGLTTFLYPLFPNVFATFQWIWIPIMLAIIVETSALAYFGIRLSMRYILYTGLAEIAFLLITSLILVAEAGPSNTATVFTLAPLGNNISNLVMGVALGISLFSRTSNLLPISEETRNPKRNVPFSLALLAAIVGVVTILSAYAQTVLHGVNNLSGYLSMIHPGVSVYMQYLGLMAAGLYTIFLANSFNSSGISFETSTARTAYAFARDNLIFPKSLAKINKHKVPGNLIIFTAILSFAVALTTGIFFGPFVGSLFLITSNSLFCFANYAIAGIGLGFYHHKSGTLNILRHLIVPWAVVVALIATIFYEIYPTPAPPLNYSVWVAGIYCLAITVTYFVYQNSKPRDLEKVGAFSL